jgi:hypothetical protein
MPERSPTFAGDESHRPSRFAQVKMCSWKTMPDNENGRGRGQPRELVAVRVFAGAERFKV